MNSDWPTVWVATEVKGAIWISEIILRPQKALKVVDGELLIAGGKSLGTFLAFGTDAKSLADVLSLDGRDVVLIPTSR